MEHEIKSIDELEMFAQEFIAHLKPNVGRATVVGLSGDLGSGKTALVKAVAKVLGVTDEVLSPTFVIAKFYDVAHPAWSRLVHIDAYRIENSDELRALHFEDMIGDATQLLFVEWPEQLGETFPADAPILNFRFVDEHTRIIESSSIF